MSSNRMVWAPGDDWPDARAEEKLSDAAAITHVEAMCYANRRGMTGDVMVPKSVLRRFAGTSDPDAAVAELIAAEWWYDKGDDWLIDTAGWLLYEDLL